MGMPHVPSKPLSRLSRRTQVETRVEALEARAYLAVSVALNAAGLLYVGGTSSSDKVFVFPHKTDAGKLVVRRNGVDTLYSAAAVKNIQVKAYSGHDRVELAGSISIPSATMLGGDGDDKLVGGVGNDAIYGQAGSDTLNGGAGRD